MVRGKLLGFPSPKSQTKSGSSQRAASQIPLFELKTCVAFVEKCDSPQSPVEYLTLQYFNLKPSPLFAKVKPQRDEIQE